jgi:RsiW-degrading membrane proteinase PrsW (M82 family)
MDPDSSVWDEPTTSAALSGETPEDATTYARWLDARLAERDVGRSWALTGLIALAAGPLAIMGAFWGSGETVFSVLALVVFGPVVEEASKLAIPTFVVERKPYMFLSRIQILICGGAAGLVFAAIENLLYLYVYVPNPTAGLVAWRWSVCVALHVGCSTIGAIGLGAEWRDAVDARRKPDLVRSARWLIIATVVHGTYNGLAIVLEIGGVGP